MVPVIVSFSSALGMELKALYMTVLVFEIDKE